ncbi:MAG: CpaD family pilus assembly protein [Hyphomicrobiales bacterium]|nr:CpaD family pilus assembly protein [Hyphomicrobiales bacterium]
MASRFQLRPCRVPAASARPRGLLAVALVAGAVSLAGCGTNRVLTDNDRGSDARLRHPIALVQQPYSLDLFPAQAAGELDVRSANQIAAFAERYRRLGQGTISMLVPRAGQRQLVDGRTLDQIRRELARDGAVTSVTLTHYPIQNPALASPVRLSFDGLRASVTHRCGDWPSDLASGSTNRGWDNKTYWNFGCASQAMLAAQAADPRDIADPQGETPADATMRMRAIDKVRKGADPATAWTTKNSNIGSVGN